RSIRRAQLAVSARSLLTKAAFVDRPLQLIHTELAANIGQATHIVCGLFAAARNLGASPFTISTILGGPAVKLLNIIAVYQIVTVLAPRFLHAAIWVMSCCALSLLQ